MAEWRQRWEALNQREQTLVGAALLAVLAAAFYVMLWEPLHQGTETLRQRHEEARSLVTWLREAGAEAESLRGNQPRAADRTTSLLSIVDKSAKRSRIDDSLKSIQPDGDSRARVRLEGVSFEALLLWLHELEQRQAVSVSNFSVDETGPGEVDARLILERPVAGSS